MKTILFIICLFVLLQLPSEAFGWGSRQPLPENLPPEVGPVIVKPIEVPEVQPPKAIFLTVGKCDNCSVAEFNHIKAAAIKVNDVVVGKCFRDELTAMPLIQTNGKTPAEVVSSLVGVKVDTEMYWTVKRVLGYTYPDVQKVWINRRYMLKWSTCDLGSLLAHESSHKAGFKHDFEATKRRPQSVPYSINRAFEACCH